MLYVIMALAGFAAGAGVLFSLLNKRWHAAQDKAVEAERQMAEASRVIAERTLVERDSESLRIERAAFDAKFVAYSDLDRENRLIKGGLLNISTTVRKLQADHRLQEDAQRLLNERGHALADRYLADVEQWVTRSVTANNYAACKQRLVKGIEWVREIGYSVSAEKERSLLEKLKADFEFEVRRQAEREEQAKIKAQIREEQQREREVQREMERLERERATIEATLAAALAQTQGQHAAQIDELRKRLAEAESRQRAVSQAQITRAGHIYVISNIGSFGDNVYKIGMTRRLDPDDRIKELGDASVPFPFDVHMMISCQDAPRLESALHREFHQHRVNKVNPRKEYFKVELADIRKFVETHHGEVQFVADAEALEYKQSLTISEEDQEYIEQVFEAQSAKSGQTEVDD